MLVSLLVSFHCLIFSIHFLLASQKRHFHTIIQVGIFFLYHFNRAHPFLYGTQHVRLLGP